jgi:hypothetical protein
MLDIVTPDIGRERLGLLMAGERISA